jgi:hypothetical protein
MRTNIWKALKHRGKAIRAVLQKYNKLAGRMNPPAPILDWKDIVNYTFVSIFEILCHSYARSNVSSKPWVLQANREISGCYFKVVRAHEEIVRLNIEMRRLYTATVDE